MPLGAGAAPVQWRWVPRSRSEPPTRLASGIISPSEIWNDTMGLSRVMARAGRLDLMSPTCCSTCRHVCAVSRSLLFPPRGPLAQTFRGDVEQRDDEDPE